MSVRTTATMLINYRSDVKIRNKKDIKVGSQVEN